MKNLNVLHVVQNLHPHSGGPSRTVVQLTDELARNPGTSVGLMFQGKIGEPAVESNNTAVERHFTTSSSEFAMKSGIPILRGLNLIMSGAPPDLLHSHGVWSPANHWVSKVARRNRIPLFIHPRGMLEPWALDHKFLKKKIGMYLYQQEDIRSASALFATSMQECENLRKLGLRHPIAVIPNGVNINSTKNQPVEQKIYRSGNRKVLFLSRIHPKKGLFNLINAWAQAAPVGWELGLVGPDEGGHLAEVINLIDERGLTQSVKYLGERDGSAKTRCYEDADLFVLPTFSENFGVVVAEALTCGVPVITTRAAPWGDLVTHRCGWWIDVGVEPLVQALRVAMALCDEERRIMGINGMRYVRRFDWRDIASQTLDVYHWTLGKALKPNFVHTD